MYLDNSIHTVGTVSQTYHALLFLYLFIHSTNVYWPPTVWQVFVVGTGDTSGNKTGKTSWRLCKLSEGEIWFCDNRILLIMNFNTLILKLSHPHLIGPHNYETTVFSAETSHDSGVGYLFFFMTSKFFSILRFNWKIINIINFMLSFPFLNVSSFEYCESDCL